MEEEETPCRPKIYQRRSSYYRRRSKLQIRDENESRNTSNNENTEARPSGRLEGVISKSSESDKQDKGEASFDLRKYIDDVKQERTDWKLKLLERKRRYKSTLKNMTRTKHSEQDVDLSALSETERNFLLVRPNYEHICEKAKKLAVMAAETSIMNEHVMHLRKRCLSRAEKKLDDLTTRIINMVD